MSRPSAARHAVTAFQRYTPVGSKVDPWKRRPPGSYVTGARISPSRAEKSANQPVSEGRSAQPRGTARKQMPSPACAYL